MGLQVSREGSMAAMVLVMFTLHGKERNTNERGVVVHTHNPSRLEAGMSGTMSSRPVCYIGVQASLDVPRCCLATKQQK